MKRAISLSVLCLISFFLRAQLKNIEFIAGPNLGMLRSNLVNPSSESKPNFDAKVGFGAGVGSNYYFNDKLSLGAQLLYQRTIVRGDFPFEYGSGRGNLELTTSFDNISVPVRAGYTIGDKIKFTGEAGGFVNCLLNSSAQDYFTYNSMTATYADASEQYKRFDAGVSLGLSSQVSLTEKLQVKLSLSDNYGLVNISALQYPYLPIRSSPYIRSNTMSLLAGIVYSLY